MKPILTWLLAAALGAATAGAAMAAESASPSGSLPAGKAAPGKGEPAAPHRQPSDALGNLKPYEERRYRIDMLDCGKEKGVDRRLCERSVQRKAATKSRRRAAGR